MLKIEIPFIGFALIVIGMAGFTALALLDGTHHGIFLIVLGWYAAVMIWAANALGRWYCDL